MAHHHLSQILQLLLKSTHQTPTSLINISKNHHLTMLYHVTPAATLILLLTFLIISFKFLPSSLLKPHQHAYIPFRVSSHTLMSLLLIAISLWLYHLSMNPPVFMKLWNINVGVMPWNVRSRLCSWIKHGTLFKPLLMYDQLGASGYIKSNDYRMAALSVTRLILLQKDTLKLRA